MPPCMQPVFWLRTRTRTCDYANQSGVFKQKLAYPVSFFIKIVEYPSFDIKRQSLDLSFEKYSVMIMVAMMATVWVRVSKSANPNSIIFSA